MRRALKWLGVALLMAVAGFFVLGPGIAERSMNKVEGAPLPEVSDEARALHASLVIVDLHSDSLLWGRNPLERAGRGQMDLPRLIDGNVALQVFSSVTQSPAGLNFERNSADARDNITLLAVGQLQPPRTWTSLAERSLYHAHKLERAAEEAPDALHLVRAPADIDAVLAERDATGRPVGALFSAEGLHNLEGDAANLQRLYDAGLRMAGLVHFFDNEVAGSMHGVAKGGLTAFGRQIVPRMEDMGVIVDIAHCSHRCVAEVLAMARRPVVSSHGGVQATCATNRNLTDDEIRGVAATGGVIGIGYFDGAVCDTSPAAIVAAMRHVRDLVGADHVALGSDFDGSVTTAFDTSQLVQVTQALLDDGWSEGDIRKAMGLNALRVLREGIKPPGSYAQDASGRWRVDTTPLPPILPGDVR
ncbi:dipeptidase [Aurantiacibacter luteus]|uniref:Peptidase M19 n=1 Tax=Aurantiacibacter luteus TaxID=1581420 RepID=A0A0G9MUH6_9SPHN|nr:dipeptidase [Aurantiacibacter luteus]KLE34385.1 peptidase M19 [Aurantiacibacter luteus]